MYTISGIGTIPTMIKRALLKAAHAQNQKLGYREIKKRIKGFGEISLIDGADAHVFRVPGG